MTHRESDLFAVQAVPIVFRREKKPRRFRPSIEIIPSGSSVDREGTCFLLYFCHCRLYPRREENGSNEGNAGDRVFRWRLCSLGSLLRCQAVSCRKHPIPKICYELHHLVTWPRVSRSSSKFSMVTRPRRFPEIWSYRGSLSSESFPFSFFLFKRYFEYLQGKLKNAANGVSQIRKTVFRYSVTRSTLMKGVRNEAYEFPKDIVARFA